MQELITYSIILATVGYVAFKIVKAFVAKENISTCASSGCSGCSVKTSCADDLNKLGTIKS